MTFSSDQDGGAARLSRNAELVLGMRAEVFSEWEREVRKLVEGADRVLGPILINTLPPFYDNIAQALSPEYPRATATSGTNIAASHGADRARMTSYGPSEIVHEYQIFRKCFSAVADKRGVKLSRNDWQIVNVSIDSAVRESIDAFTEMHDGLRRQIAASLSHDMRGPLSVVMSAAQVMIAAPSRPDSPAIAEKILSNAKRLDDMVRELLDALSFSRGQRLPLSLSRFDMARLTMEVCEHVNDGGEPKCVVAGDSIIGHWCENSIRRAIENLVGNAVKYGDGEPIRIKVGEAFGRIILSVHNSGNAIPANQTGRIFQFLRREGRSQAAGWGIGLPFVQSVAESHGGTISLDSSPESGTTFTMDLPVDCRPFVDKTTPH
jgi:signal transduction histidine kinase